MVDEQIENDIKKYSNIVYRLAMSILNNKDDSEDVYQEVIIKFYKQMNKFESEEHKKAWVIRVTINQCKSLLRMGWFRNRSEIDENIPYLDKEIDNVYYAVEKLPFKYKTVIYLYYYEQYKISEISDILGKKQSTIKSQLLRAKEMLRKELKGGIEDE